MNENYNEILPQVYQDGQNFKKKKNFFLNQRSIGEDMEKLEPSLLLVGMQNNAIEKRVWWVLKKLNTALLYDPTILLLGIYPGKLKTYVHKTNKQTKTL